MITIHDRYQYLESAVSKPSEYLRQFQGLDTLNGQPVWIIIFNEIDLENPFLPELKVTLSNIYRQRPAHYFNFLNYFEEETQLTLIYPVQQHTTLLSLLNENKYLDELEAMQIFARMAQGVSALHSLDIVHSFVNLQNFIVNKEGQILLTHSNLTLKVFYLSPQYRIDRLPSKESDWFSMGICLHKLLRGTFPFNAKDPQEFIEAVKTKNYRKITALDPRLPFQIRLTSKCQIILNNLLDVLPSERIAYTVPPTPFSAKQISENIRQRYKIILAGQGGYLALKGACLFWINYYEVRMIELQKQYLQSMQWYDSEEGVKVVECVGFKKGLIMVENYYNQGRYSDSPASLYFLVNLLRVYQKCVGVHSQVSSNNVVLHMGKIRLKIARPMNQIQFNSLKTFQFDQWAPQLKLKNKQQLALKKVDVWSLGYLVHATALSKFPIFDLQDNLILDQQISDQLKELLLACLKKDAYERADLYELIINPPKDQIVKAYYDKQKLLEPQADHPAIQWKNKATIQTSVEQIHPKKNVQPGVGKMLRLSFVETLDFVGDKYRALSAVWTNKLRQVLHILIWQLLSLLYFSRFLTGAVQFLNHSLLFDNYTSPFNTTIIVDDPLNAKLYGWNYTLESTNLCLNASYLNVTSLSVIRSQLVATASLGCFMFVIVLVLIAYRVFTYDMGRTVFFIGRKVNGWYSWQPLLTYFLNRMLIVQLISAHHAIFGHYLVQVTSPCFFWNNFMAFNLFFLSRGTQYLYRFLPSAYLFFVLAGVLIVVCPFRPGSLLIQVSQIVLLAVWTVMRVGRWPWGDQVIFQSSMIFGLIPQLIQAIAVLPIIMIDILNWQLLGRRSTKVRGQEEGSSKGEDSLQMSYMEEASEWLQENS